MSDVGLEVVRIIYDRMKIDRQWSIWHPRGFTWWGYRLAQHIWADRCFEDKSFILSRVHARTDFLDGFTNSDESIVRLMQLSPVLTSLSGPIRDPRNPSRIQLAANVYVHAETKDWLGHVLATAAIMQAVQAHLEVQRLAEPLKARPAYSAHPRSGLRTDWDDILNVPARLLVPMGEGASRYRGREMLDALERVQRPPCVLATGDENGFCAEFPFGPLTSLLHARADLPHLLLGSGLYMMLQLPEGPSGVENPEAARMALELNEREQRPDPFTGSHFLGSWCPDPFPGTSSSASSLSFVSFLPNGLFAKGWTTTLTQKAWCRAHWVATDVFQAGCDFEEAVSLKLGMSLEEATALVVAGQNVVKNQPTTAGMSKDRIEHLQRALKKKAAAIERKRSQSKENTTPLKPSCRSASLPEPIPPVRFPCPHCGKILKAPGEKAGHKSRCPYCRSVVTVSARD